MRRYGVTPDQVEEIIVRREKADVDIDGNPRFYGRIGDTIYRVVQPAGEPDFVKSVHPRRSL